MNQNRGFTLIELMVALVIAGILYTIALPAYTDYVTRSHRADAHSALLDISARQERFMAQNNTYTTEISGSTGLNMGSNDSSSGYYNMSVGACSGESIAVCYVVTATATGGQASDTECATISYSSRGVKSGTSATCW